MGSFLTTNALRSVLLSANPAGAVAVSIVLVAGAIAYSISKVAMSEFEISNNGVRVRFK